VVCAMYKPTHKLKIIHMQDIPNIHLLKASDESLTTITWKGQSYSLQGVAFKKRDLVHICDTCITQLKEKGELISTQVVCIHQGLAHYHSLSLTITYYHSLSPTITHYHSLSLTITHYHYPGCPLLMCL
jgi:hypothetical protein